MTHPILFSLVRLVHNSVSPLSTATHAVPRSHCPHPLQQLVFSSRFTPQCTITRHHQHHQRHRLCLSPASTASCDHYHILCRPTRPLSTLITIHDHCSRSHHSALPIPTRHDLSSTNLLTCFTCSCHSTLFVLSGRDIHCQTTQLATVTTTVLCSCSRLQSTLLHLPIHALLPRCPSVSSSSMTQSTVNLLNCLMCICPYGTACLIFITEGIFTARQLSSRP
jgi:hypothetical protein